MLKRSKGFVLADSLLALGIISLGLFSLMSCQTVLYYQQARHIRQLTAARLAKEASDGYRINHHPATVSRLGYRAVVKAGQATVWYRDKIILRVVQ